jgi:tetratricopeptide (TPR) repeat protein
MRFCRFAGMIFVMMFIVATLLGSAAPVSQTGPGASAHMSAGIAHEAKGNFRLAVADFSAALAAKDLSAEDRVRAVYDRGVALDALGRTSEAIDDYSEALRLRKDFAPALNNRGNAYRRMARFSEAKRDYWAALAVSGGAAEYSYFGLGQIAEAQGDKVQARGFYHRALAINRNFKIAAQSIAFIDEKRKSIAPSGGAAPALRLGGGEHAPKPHGPAILPPTPTVQPAKVAKSEGGTTKDAQVKELSAKVAAAKAEVERLKALKALKATQKNQRAATAAPGRATSAGQAFVQIGAYRSQAEAEAGWHKVVAGAGDILSGQSPIYIPVDLPGKGHYIRLRLAMPGTAAARKLCTDLSSRGQDCIQAKG